MPYNFFIIGGELMSIYYNRLKRKPPIYSIAKVRHSEFNDVFVVKRRI